MNFSRKPAATKSDFALHRAGAMVVDVVGNGGDGGDSGDGGDR